jgi:pimeloyl-ACP methyl ester carboxylesterase
LAAIAVGALAVTLPGPQVAPAAAAPARAAIQSAAVQPSAAASTVPWTPCRDGFQCATVRVPLDYDQPAGAKIDLAVIRLPAGDPKRRIGSLFVNPGGPGGSGVDVVRGAAPIVPLELRARFDIVGFDPRGIIRSTPLRCFDTLDEALAVLPPFAFPVTRPEETVQRTADRTLASACRSHGGPILNHMSTADVARDMDFLRAAVGDKKLNYLGFSYGSFLGQVYANLYPNRVRSIVIDGVLDPIAWTTGHGPEARTQPFTTRLRSDEGAQRTLNEFFRLCDAAGPNCDFAGHAKQRYAAMAAKLRKSPLVIGEPPDTFTFTYADLVANTLGGLYSPAIWPDLGAFLASVEAQVNAANPAAATAAGARVKATLARLRAGLGLAATAQEPYNNVVEGFPGVGCSDSVNPASFDAWPRAAADADRRFGYFGRLWTWASSVCHPWPATAGQDRYLGPWNRHTASPVLVVGNFFDPATRYQGAVTASRLLPNSRLLSYAGWGHTAFLSGNFCVDSNVTAYLLTTRVPKAGTVCQPQGSPFEPLSATNLARAKALAKLGVPMLPEATRRAVGTTR